VAEPAHDAVLALDPRVVVGRGAAQRAVEQLLVAAADVHRDRQPALARGRDEVRAELPRGVVRERPELELVLLGEERLERVAAGRRHARTLACPPGAGAGVW